MREVLYSIKGPKTLLEMTWEEVAQALQETDIVLVVMGATEQHGPHLPLGTDTMQAVELCKRIVTQLAGDDISAVVSAPIPFGMSSYHMGFPGTITLRPTTYYELAMDVCRCLYTHGFRRFVFPLGHGGNYAMMQVIAQQLVDESEDAQALVLNWLPSISSAYPALAKTDKPEGHAGGREISRQLDTHPELVQMEGARAFYPEAGGEQAKPDHPLLGGGVFKPFGPARRYREAYPHGFVGNPNLATAEIGGKLYQIGVDWMCEVIRAEFGTSKKGS